MWTWSKKIKVIDSNQSWSRKFINYKPFMEASNYFGACLTKNGIYMI